MARVKIRDFLDGNKERKVKMVSDVLLSTFNSITSEKIQFKDEAEELQKILNLCQRDLAVAQAERNSYKSILERFLPPVEQTEMYCTNCNNHTKFIKNN